MRRALALALGLLLGACAAPSKAPEPELLAGRMALRIDAHAGAPAQQWSAGFELRGRADQGQLQLLSPLGTVLAQARWGAQAAELHAQGSVQRFDSLAELSKKALGEALPLQALPDWLRGRAWSGAPQQPRPEGFEQAGWSIDLASRAQGLVVVRRETPPAVTLRAMIDTLP